MRTVQRRTQQRVRTQRAAAGTAERLATTLWF
jgi:hypothetical protein